MSDKRTRQLRAERDRLQEAVNLAMEWFNRNGWITSYGYPLSDDPHEFSPDLDACSPQEIKNWEEATARWDKGERPVKGPTHEPIVVDGKAVGHVTRAPWGVGVSSIKDPELQEMFYRVGRAAGILKPAQPAEKREET